MLLEEKIQEQARVLGFDLCGFTSDFIPTHKDYFLSWLKEKKYADMTWLARNTDKRLAPQTLCDGTQMAIVVGRVYPTPAPEAGFQIARYAAGRDYHHSLKKDLETLAQFIAKDVGPSFSYRSFVDTGPILERDLAAKAGLGWIGKNTCLINADLGSYVFLGVIFVNLLLKASHQSADQCARCRLCLDACPTQALTPYQLDASRCLAYHNIEKRGEREKSYWQALGDHVFGCDICQEVCPWNRDSSGEISETSQPPFSKKDLPQILTMTKTQYMKKTRDTALSRIKYEDFMRNIFLVLANTKELSYLNLVLDWQKNHPDLHLSECKYCIEKIS